MPAYPSRLLKNVYWSFGEPTPNSPEEFVAAAREYAASIEAVDPSAELALVLPFSDARIRYAFFVRAETGEWLEKTEEVRVIAPGGLTGAALMWELHAACHATVGQDDHCFFEGFELASAGDPQEPPVYEVLLGS